MSRKDYWDSEYEKRVILDPTGAKRIVAAKRKRVIKVICICFVALICACIAALMGVRAMGKSKLESHEDTAHPEIVTQETLELPKEEKEKKVIHKRKQYKVFNK